MHTSGRASQALAGARGPRLGLRGAAAPAQSRLGLSEASRMRSMRLPLDHFPYRERLWPLAPSKPYRSHLSPHSLSRLSLNGPRWDAEAHFVGYSAGTIVVVRADHMPR